MVSLVPCLSHIHTLVVQQVLSSEDQLEEALELKGGFRCLLDTYTEDKQHILAKKVTF